MINSTTKKKHVLYLPSTPLNLLVSIAHAVAKTKDQVSQIILIDQKNKDKNVYFKILDNWHNCPFETVDLTLGVGKGLNKLRERKQNFLKLSKALQSFSVDAIAVGSDRRIEFQYLMQLKKKESHSVEGWLLDDGLYSYAGRPYHWFKDGMNSYLKKLIYGFWWEEPKTVGASKYINKAWFFQPNDVVPELQVKEKYELDGSWFSNKMVLEFSENIGKEFGLCSKVVNQLQAIDLFLLIPHPNNIKKMFGYESRINKFLLDMKQKGVKVGAKYHPRTESDDPLNLKEKYQTLLVSKGLAFEFVLPFLKQKSIVIGDVGTALLTAQWLRSDLNVYAVLFKDDEFQNKFEEIYHQLNIKIVTDFKDFKKIVKL